MTAHFLFGEVWSVEMHSTDASASRRSPAPPDRDARVQHPPDLRWRSRGGCREDRSCPAAKVGAVGRLHCLHCAVHVVGPVRAVNVDIDKTGYDPAAFRFNYRAIPWGTPAGNNGFDASVP